MLEMQQNQPEIADQSSGETKQVQQGTIPPSKMPREQLLRTLKAWWKKDGPHAKQWRDGDKFNLGAKMAFDIVAMRQWDEKDVATLEASRRSPIVFNRVLPTISAVVGIEINSRHEITYLPRTSDFTSETGMKIVNANETLAQASKAFADECDAEDHESEAFRDSIICGLGAVEVRVDYDEEPDGKYIEKTLDVLEIAWDFRAREKNLADSQRRWHLKRMPLEQAQGLFPGVPFEEMNCFWANADVEAGKMYVDDDGRSRDKDLTGEELDPQNEVHILRCQWWEYEPVMIVARPDKPDAPVHMSEDEYKQFSAELAQKFAAAGMEPPQMPCTQGRRKVYREVYIGRDLLCDPSEIQYKEGFTLKFITGIPDKNKGHWFGLVAVMRDPQRWANSWLSQTQHILNSTAKGGILAEMDAFKDPRQAEQTYARPDAITWMQPNAISKGKVMQKPGVGISAGHANLMEFAISSIRDVTGINLELLGLRDANQPGILEAQRKQAAMTILAPWFDSLKRFRKEVGRCRLYYIQEYLASPDRFIRIAGEDGYTLVPLLKEKVIGKHDVVVADAPTSPNQKEEEWNAIKELLPVFGAQVAQSPELAMIVLECSPLSSKRVQAFRDAISKPKPEQVEQQQLAQRGMQAKVALDEAKTEQTRADATSKSVDALVQFATAMAGAMQAKQSPEQLGQEITNYVQNQRRAPLIADEEPAIYAQESPLSAPRMMGMPGVPSGPPHLPILDLQASEAPPAQAPTPGP